MTCEKCGSDCVSAKPGVTNVCSPCAMCGLWMCGVCRRLYGTGTGHKGEDRLIYWCGDKECEEGCNAMCDE